MLIFSRRVREAVAVGGENGLGMLLKVTVMEVRAGRVKLGFEAADDCRIHRWEVWQRIHHNGRHDRLAV